MLPTFGRLLLTSAAARGPGSASDAEGSVHKPQLGKNPHHEAMKTKRDLAHDHHLSRRGKGAAALFSFLSFIQIWVLCNAQPAHCNMQRAAADKWE